MSSLSRMVPIVVAVGALVAAGAGPAGANVPPDCSRATPSQSILWPPNHKLVDVAVDGVVDPDGDSVALVVTAIAQDEPLAGTDDGHGGSCDGAFMVCVPHDHRPGASCGDQGPLVDSTGTDCRSGCDPGECISDDLPPACDGEDLPRTVRYRIDRAAHLLRRATDSSPARARRLARKAARLLRLAGSAAEHAAARGLQSTCAEALHDQLEDARSCAECAAHRS
jgi:hypothetical protein